MSRLPEITTDQYTKNSSARAKDMGRPLRVSIPVKATARTAGGVEEYQGHLELLGEGHARITFDQPLAQGTELSLVMEFKDRRNREIRFRYDGKVASPTCTPWYEVSVALEDGVAISGKDAREILSELFPEEDSEPFGKLTSENGQGSLV